MIETALKTDHQTVTATLSDDHSRTLLAIVRMMIPANQAYDVPGAGDPTIFADILSVAARNLTSVAAALEPIEQLSLARQGRRFADLADDDAFSLVDEFRASQTAEIEVLVTITAQCYYRDDRVMRALGMEARPPFPKGFAVEQGDWSLLDPVRQRAKFYRKV